MSIKTTVLPTCVAQLLRHIDDAQTAQANNFMEPGDYTSKFNTALINVMEDVFLYRIGVARGEIVPPEDSTVLSLVGAALSFAGLQCLCANDKTKWTTELRQSVDDMFRINTDHRKVLAD